MNIYRNFKYLEYTEICFDFFFFYSEHNCIFIVFSILKHFCSVLVFILHCCPFCFNCLTRPFNFSGLRHPNMKEITLISQVVPKESKIRCFLFFLFFSYINIYLLLSLHTFPFMLIETCSSINCSRHTVNIG